MRLIYFKIGNVLVIVLILILNNFVQGQTIDKPFEQNRLISLGLNSDAFAGMELGYTQNPGFLAEKNFQLYMRFSFPFLLSLKDKSFDTWEIKIGARSELFKKNNFGTISDIKIFLMHHHQILGNFMPLGMNVRLTPCYHFSRGYLGLQMNWNQTIATHISHSQYVKETFEDLSVIYKTQLYNHPKDGWYSNTGSHFSFGLEGGWEMSRRFSFYRDLGIIKFSSLYTGMFDAMMMGQVPFYGNVRLFYKM